MVNTNTLAVDMSGWTLAGALRYRFKPGTVLAAGQVLYLTLNVTAFRRRRDSPKNGDGCFIQGSYQRDLTADGVVLLRDRIGATSATRPVAE